MSNLLENSYSASESHSTYQLGTIILRVRDDLEVHVREHGQQPVYVIEDELTSRFFRIGEAEYTFLSMLDGKTTFATALGRTATRMKRDALSEEQAAGFCKWLVQMGLASTEQSRSIDRLVEARAEGRKRRTRGRWSVLTQRFPLCHPRKSIDLLNQIFGWMFSIPVGLVWILTVGLALFTVGTRWSELLQSTGGIVAADNWIWLLASWFALKLVHEAAHAVACRRFGGTLREAGVLFVLMIPLPYVDVTSAWRMASRWHRILVSAAGMLAELLVAAVAAIIWSRVDDGLMKQNALNLMISASVTTLLFNANPLMRFDGYYILCDLLGMPNLYTHGHNALKQWGKRWILGLDTHQQQLPEGRPKLVLAYGAAAFLWRIMVCIGLVLAADALFYGLGSLLAVVAIFSWAVIPLLRLLRFVLLGSKVEQPSRFRFGGIVLATGSLLFMLWNWMPWYYTASAPMVVDYYPKVDLRTSVSGFVDEVYVQSGDHVNAGDLLVSLRNEDIESKLTEHLLAVEQSKQRIAGFLDRNEIAAYQVEIGRLQALEDRSQELRKQRESLKVRAPTDGIILTHELEEQLGRYINIGSRMLQLGSENQLQLVATVDQMQEDVFRDLVGDRVYFHIRGTGTEWHESEVRSVAPRASRELPHPALGATAGGPLSVRQTQSEDALTAESTRRESASANFELVDPHFLLKAELPSPLHAIVNAGQTGKVCVRSNSRTLGHHLSGVLWNWWDARSRAVEKQLYER